MYRYFCAHHPDDFPQLPRIHRSTFARHAADSYHLVKQVWCWIRDYLPYDAQLGMVDSLALAICQLQLRGCWPGVMCQFAVTPGNWSELAAAHDLRKGTHGIRLGDRNFWVP